MFEALTNWVAAHAAAMLVTLIVTGTIALAAQLDSMLRDAGRGAPWWLRIASRVLSELARNVSKAKNCPVAQLKKLRPLVLVLLVPFTALALGCVHIPDGPKIGGMAEAYDVSGPTIEISADGAITCTTTDPVNYPCDVNFAATQEAWEPLLRALEIPFEALLQLFNRTFGP